MIDLTGILRPWFVRRADRTMRAALNSAATQENVLRHLCAANRDTEWGRAHAFGRVTDHRSFVRQVPLCDYEQVRRHVMRMVEGEHDVLVAGGVTRFAQSSGTSGGKSKYIPLPMRSLTRCHYQGTRDVVAFYLRNNPSSRLFSGRAFILGGSFANELSLPAGVRVGDLSAHLIERIPRAAELYRIPQRRVALMPDWHEKLPLLIEAAVNANVTNLSGVPSWFMTVLQGVLDYTGASSLHEVWPGLEVFFHGGISFAPYREQYMSMVDRSKMHFVETYNASEGFFGVQDRADEPGMLLLMDNDVYYEFIDIDDLDKSEPDTLLPHELKQGGIYAMVITSSNGLWRYKIGDTVRVETVSPLRITIAGRTQSYINAFGEELMVYNAEAAMTRVCRELGVDVLNYTAAPHYAEGGHRGRHDWVIEFGRRRPEDMDVFATRLDKALQDENSDYQAKRAGDIFLDRLEITEARQGMFDRWLATTGKLGGQRKIPRLSNDRRILDALDSLSRS